MHAAFLQGMDIDTNQINLYAKETIEHVLMHVINCGCIMTSCCISAVGCCCCCEEWCPPECDHISNVFDMSMER